MFGLLILLGAPAHADSDYVFDEVTPGHSAKLVVAGYALGHAGESTVTIPGKTEFISLVGVESGRCEGEISALKSRNEAAAKNFMAATTSFNDISKPVVKTEKNEPKTLAFALSAFQSCAEQTLPTLKYALAAELSGDHEQADRFLIATNAERADETGASASGVACGRYLGPAAIARPSKLSDEIKILLALTARTGPEQLMILKALVVAKQTRSPTEALHLWTFYWRRLSVLAALGQAPLPTFEKLKSEAKPTSPGVSREPDLDAAHNAGLQFTAKLLPEDQGAQ